VIRLTSSEEIHQLIGDLRRAAGKTQRGLAADIGTRASAINRFENEGQRPSLASLIALAGALGYDVALVEREQPKSTVHHCPDDNSGVTSCCARTPYELPRDEQITEDPALVTCRVRLHLERP
jgi:transcriptional regulator with XRE-family HTH domain